MPDQVSQSSTLDTREPGAEILEEQRRVAYAAEMPAARPQPHPLAGAAKDAGIAAAISLVLAGPVVGLRTESAIGGLSFATYEHGWPIDGLTQFRWLGWLSSFNLPVVLGIVAVVFFGRLALNLTLWRPDSKVLARIGTAVAAAGGRRMGALASSNSVYIGAIALVLAFVLPFMPFANRYVMDQSIVILTYVMLGWGLNIVVGLAGLLDLGYVAFYAVGAYSFALLATNFDLGFWVSLPMAGLLAAGWGLILGFPVLRLRGDYLAIVTLAFGEIIRIILVNWYDLTNGPDGISGIPRPTLFGIEFSRDEGGFADLFGLEYTPLQRIVYLYYIILVLALITSAVTQRLRRLPIGRAWEALREDEIACRSLGINTTNTKLTAFACGAFFGGLAGSFFATRQGFISPESFTALESFIILAVVVLGGLGSQIGVVIAVILLNTAFELRGLAQYRMLIVGLSMVLIMVWRPRGLIATRRPSVFLKKRKAVPGELVTEGRG